MTRRHIQLGGWLVLCLAACGGRSQARPAALAPVHWSAQSPPLPDTRPGTRFTIVLHAAIDDGWHLYALPERESFPLSTEIALAANGDAELLRVEQAKPRHTLDPELHVLTAWFAQTATFTLRLANATGHRPQDLQVLVRYQACNDRMCLPPRSETVPVAWAASR